jgi:hypothetical protein
MPYSPSIEDLLTALLRETTTQDLTEANKATIRSIVQALDGELLSKLDSVTDMGASADESPNRQSDSALVEVLGDHVETAGVIIEILSMLSVSQNALNALRRVELQLTALTIGVSDLRLVLEQSTRPQPLRHWRQSLMSVLRRLQFYRRSDKSRIKLQHLALCALMICIPIGLRLGVPALLHQADRLGWLERFHLQNQNVHHNTPEPNNSKK